MSRELSAAAAVASFAAALLLQGSGAEPRPASRPEGALPPPFERLALPSVAACGGCHRAAYEEWAGSLHAKAWTNANVREATRGFELAECRPCHSPMPALATGLDRAPAFRDFNREDGVHCLSCHGIAGGVAAARAAEGAPCNPKEEPGLLRAEMCFPCHQPTHGAFDEYAVSSAKKEGKRCADCHMPPRAGGSGRSHAGLGGLDEAFVRRAIEARFERRGAEVRVLVTNKTGHKFPGEIPSRSFVVRVTYAAGEPLHLTLRKPRKHEAREDDRLRPDESRELRFGPRGADAVARIDLLFKPYPATPDGAAFALASWP